MNCPERHPQLSQPAFISFAAVAKAILRSDTLGQPLPRTSSMIAALTAGIRRCQLATSSRRVAPSRRSSYMPIGQFSQTVWEKTAFVE
jgi:hypothetical protein